MADVATRALITTAIAFASGGCGRNVAPRSVASTMDAGIVAPGQVRAELPEPDAAALLFPPSGAVAPTGESITALTRLTPGETVQVRWSSEWYVGEVVSVESDGRARIHYVGWSSSADETVSRDRIRLAGPMRPASLRTPIQPTGLPIHPDTRLANGYEVQINWRGNWYRGNVLDALSDGRVRVAYLGWGRGSDEVLERARLRTAGPVIPAAPTSGTIVPTSVEVNTGTPLPPGRSVQVNSNGSWYEGTVVAVLANGTVRVHYVGWPSDTDETVARTRLRLPP